MFIKFVLYSKTNKTTAIVLPLQLTSPYIYIYTVYPHGKYQEPKKFSNSFNFKEYDSALPL